MKPFSAFVGTAAAVAMLALVPTVSADALGPGDSVVPVPTADPVVGVEEASAEVDFLSLDLKGTLISKVISGDTGNALGGLTFTYQIVLDAASPHAVSRLSVSDFSAVEVDVNYEAADVEEIVPFAADRGEEDGAVVGFYFPFGSGLPSGETSALLVVRTDSDAYEPTIASVINGQATSVESFAPVLIPEPTSLALLLVGLGGLAYRVRRH
jgi:hypothetical protein